MKKILAALVLPLALFAPAAPAHAALGAGVTHEAVFSDPFSKTSKLDYSIHTRLIRLVNEAPAGAAVNYTAWGLEYAPFADALINAHKRGVVVQVVHNGKRSSATSERVRTALGSRFRVCTYVTSYGTGGGCLSKHGYSYMHSKLLLVSRTGTKSSVVVTGSTNMSNHGYESNDMLIIAGDPKLYDGHLRYFNDLFSQRRNTNYMTSTNGTVSSSASAAKSWFSPRLTSTGTTGVEPSTSVTTQAATDPVVAALRRLTGGSGCSLKMAERYWNSERRHVTAQVNRIRKAGCTVRTISDDMDGPTRDSLKAAGVDVRGVKRKTGLAYPVNVRMHHKFFVMEGTIDGVAGRREVWHGSHNLVGSALRFADDTLMRVSHGTTVSAYEGQFDRLFSISYRL